MSWWRRLWALIRSRRLDRELDEELGGHIAMRTAANRASGATDDEARRAAERQFGNRTRIKEQTRDRDILPWVESVVQDLRYAARQLRRSPGFAMAAIAAMALGIGANAAVFTLVNAVLLRALPFDQPDRIVSVWMQPPNGARLPFSQEDFEDLRDGSTSFSELVGTLGTSINVADDDSTPERVPGMYASWNLFRLLGVQPVLGRDFREDDDQLGADPVVIISYGLWQSRYGGASDVLGRLVRLNSRQASIVGVMPRRFAFPRNQALWIPRMMLPRDSFLGRRQHNIGVIGRLAPGVELAPARAEVGAVASRLAQEYPDSNRDLAINLLPYQEATTSRQTRLIFLTFLGAVGFVLLVACANVANLLLARSVGRAREIAIRVAQGAGRWRVIRQLLVESVLVASIGGALGLLIAFAGVRWFARASVTVDRPYWEAFTFDPVVFAFVAALCVVTGVVFGLAPALHVSRTDVNSVLKEGGRGGGGVRARRWAGALIVIELVLTLVLLSGAGFMMRSFLGMYQMDLGFEPTNVKVMQLYLPLTKYVLAKPEMVVDIEQRLADRLEAVSGFRASALASSPPTVGTIRGNNSQAPPDTRPVFVDGQEPAPGEQPTFVKTVSAGDEYFDTVGIPILRGRAFERSDGLPGRGAAIVNERFAALHLGGRDPIGHTLVVPGLVEVEDRPETQTVVGAGPLTIVGVVPDVRQGDLDRAEPDPVVYVPMRMDSRPGVIGLLVRAPGAAVSVAARVRQELAILDPDVPVFNAQTMDEVLADERGQYVLFLGMFSVFAGIALFLSAVGLYSVTAYAVKERTQEVGVRMALGAERRQIVWLMLKRGLVQLAIGLPMGIAGALVVGRLLESLLFRTSPRDMVTLVGVTVLLGLVAVLACVRPALRAARLDPTVALRHE